MNSPTKVSLPHWQVNPSRLYSMEPSMRCKAGELAIVTRPEAWAEDLRGRVVRVVSMFHTDSGRSAWNIEEPETFVMGESRISRSLDGVFLRGQVYRLGQVYDEWLTPLRGLPADEEINALGRIDSPIAA